MPNQIKPTSPTVKELKQETLPADSQASNTDRPIKDDARRTVAAALARSLSAKS